MLWRKEYSGGFHNNFLSICLAGSGGYVAVGDANGCGLDGQSAWVVKVDSMGHMLWEEKWREGNFCTFTSVKQTEHGFAVYGGCDSTQVVAVIDEEGKGFRVTDSGNDRAQEVVRANGQSDLVPATWTRANDSTYVMSVHLDARTTVPFQIVGGTWLTRIFELPSGEYMATGGTHWWVRPDRTAPLE
jgi:hypothetical protein